MGLAELTDRLERDAEARIAAIAARADAEVSAVDAERAREVARARGEALAERRAARRACLEAELAEARRAARAEVLRAEHALVERVLARAATLFDDAARGAGYLAAAARAAQAELAYFEEGGAIARARPEVAAALAAAGVPVEEDPRARPGFVLVARDGSLTLDETLDARAARLRPRIAIAVLAELRR